MSHSILLLAHVDESGSTLPQAAYEALGTALDVAKQLGQPLSIGLIGGNLETAASSVSAAGAQKIFAVSSPDFAQARYATDAAAAEAICRAAAAEIVIAPATSRFLRALPGLAHRLQGCVDTHLTSIEVIAGRPTATRWFYRQRLEAVVQRDARPWILLLDSGVDRNARRGKRANHFCAASSRGQAHGRYRRSLTQERRTNHSSGRETAFCRRGRLDQETT
jgi:electron transfer flavoprotein alpha subunit